MKAIYRASTINGQTISLHASRSGAQGACIADFNAFLKEEEGKRYKPVRTWKGLRRRCNPKFYRVKKHALLA